MGKITVETCEIEGLKVITPTVFGDERGYFMETYNYNDFKEAGIDAVILTHNIDQPFITHLESKNEGIKFARIDADLSDSFKEETSEDEI